MSLRDFNEPAQPIGTLHTDPSGNGAGLNAFHTTSPADREPSNMPKIIGALAVALMVGAAGVGLYAYSGSSQSKPVVADNNLPQPPAPATAPIAPPPAPAPQQAANTPDAGTPAPADTTPAPVKDASAKPVKHHLASNPNSTQTASTASDASSVRMNADSTQSSQAPAQQAAIAPSTTPLPAAPQPSPSDVAANNAQASQPVQSAPDATAQQPAPAAPQQQPEQAGAAPAQAQ